MSAREQLHALVERLPDDQVESALRALEAMQAQTTDKLVEMLEHCEEDDEPLTEEQQRELEQGLAEIARGDTIPWEQVKKELG